MKYSKFGDKSYTTKTGLIVYPGDIIAHRTKKWKSYWSLAEIEHIHNGEMQIGGWQHIDDHEIVRLRGRHQFAPGERVKLKEYREAYHGDAHYTTLFNEQKGTVTKWWQRDEGCYAIPEFTNFVHITLDGGMKISIMDWFVYPIKHKIPKSLPLPHYEKQLQSTIKSNSKSWDDGEW